MSGAAPGFFATVMLLLRIASRREGARMAANAKQRQAAAPAWLRASAKRRPASVSAVFAVSVGAMLLAQLAMGAIYAMQTRSAADVIAERSGRLAVSERLISDFADADRARASNDIIAKSSADAELAKSLDREARDLAKWRGGERSEWRAELEHRHAADGVAGFVEKQKRFGSVAATGASLLSLLLVLWWLSLALMGEHLGFDLSRRRHPMWEWYLRFPVSHTAVFVAEALAPVASNPILLTAPVLFATVAGLYQGSWIAALAALPVALPLVAAAAMWSKALEVLVMLRAKPRNRAAWLAVATSIGFAAFFGPLVVMATLGLQHRVMVAIAPLLEQLPSPGLLLGTGSVGGWLVAASLSLTISAVLAGAAALVLRAAVTRGLEGGFGDDTATTSVTFARDGGRWFDDPLWRKDFLWLRRDRGALLQIVALPLALAAMQLFNFRNLLAGAALTWNHLAGIVVGVAAYVLFAAGPRALASEGPALVLTLSWPRGLDDVLRRKVSLLFALVSVMVYACFAVITVMFPHDWIGIALVAAAWPLFGLAVAEKAVTLVQAPNQSGVVEPLAPSRLFIAGLGNYTFAMGVYSAQWSVALAAIVLNWMFAGALWQQFRHSLAYLFDRDAEPMLRPPTVLSGAVAIVAQMELGVVFVLLALLVVDRDGVWAAMTFGYGIASIIVAIAVCVWHRRQGVTLYDLFALDDRARRAPLVACLAAAAIGALLAAAAFGYEHLLRALPLPDVHEAMEKADAYLRDSPDMRVALAVLAIGIAPWIEEFVFRGLVFRALLPQWGFVRALAASSAFFAILHPVPFWPLIFAVGAASAFVFWRWRALLPCIVLHTVYNALVIALR